MYSFYAIASYIKNNENKDPREIIIDELMGQSIPVYLYEISNKTTKGIDETLIYYYVIFFFKTHIHKFF